MDPKKTGAFIAVLRKEMGLTQKDLAQRLHVSDKAISRWETGKGFPETGMLKPLSDLLGVSVGELLSGERMAQEQVKEQADQVIVQSLKKSDRSMSALAGVAILAGVFLIPLIVILLVVYPLPHKLTTLEMVNSSKTRLLYELGDDNVEPNIVYPEFTYREYKDGYEYHIPDGSERYVFTYVPGYSEKPVMSFMHCSAKGSSLFGIMIGQSTTVNKNPVLGVEESYSLDDYFDDMGFSSRRLPSGSEFYGRDMIDSEYIDGQRCRWRYYWKDNVFISVLLTSDSEQTLMGYEIGLYDEHAMEFLKRELFGYPFKLMDPYNLVKDSYEFEHVYRAGTPIMLFAKQPPEGCDTLYLYINDAFVGEFKPTADPEWCFRISMKTVSGETRVLVTPEKQHD